MRKTKRGSRGICVYCGREGERRERDHIPPKNLFRHPRPANLITIPCCSECHEPTGMDDEYFQTAVIMRADLADHPAAAALLPSVLKGLRRPEAAGRRNGFLASAHKTEMQTLSRLYLGDVYVYYGETARVERVATRIVQGLFYHERGRRLPNEYKAEAYLVSKFDVRRDKKQLNQLSELAIFTSSQPLKTIGDGVFGYKFCGYDDDKATVWVLIFYEKVIFVGLTYQSSIEVIPIKC